MNTGRVILPLLADSIDIPLVVVYGLSILVPLIAFQVFVEALVLQRIWRLPYGQLCTFAFFANLWSLAAGLPTKILNAVLTSLMVPEDIPGFFAAYPYAAVRGALVYFAATVAVEVIYAFRWLRRNELQRTRAQVWRGLFFANVATYVVMAPVYYFAARPSFAIDSFTKDTRWTDQPSTTVIFADGTNQHLCSANLDGSSRQTIVPAAVSDYLISTNLNVCLYRGTNGDLNLHRRDRAQVLIWKTTERFLLNQTAFSPSGERAAYVSDKNNSVEVVEALTGKRTNLPLNHIFKEPSVAWSQQETIFFVRGFPDDLRLAIRLSQEGDPVISPLESSNAPPLLRCYGRTGKDRWGSVNDWGISYRKDMCGDLEAFAWPGLDSGVVIDRIDEQIRTPILRLSVRPGLLHMAAFHFGDVAFLPDCREFLFECHGYIYLLDANRKRLGTFVRGDRFILLTDRYEKGF
jgi:hypothetical protein